MVELGRDPSDEELAEDLGITVEKVRLLFKCSATPTSLDAAVGTDRDKENTLEDMIEDSSIESGEQSVEEARTAPLSRRLSALFTGPHLRSASSPRLARSCPADDFNKWIMNEKKN